MNLSAYPVPPPLPATSRRRNHVRKHPLLVRSIFSVFLYLVVDYVVTYDYKVISAGLCPEGMVQRTAVAVIFFEILLTLWSGVTI